VGEGVSEFVCVTREDGERAAGRSREPPTQAAPRWSLPLPLTRTLADLRLEFPDKPYPREVPANPCGEGTTSRVPLMTV
jgi:hypothetical protein